jgi:hypothetical protein
MALMWAGSRTITYAYQGGISLNFGEAITGTLDDEIFRQIYSFEGRAGEVITISMNRIEGDLDPYLLLVDGEGAVLALNDDNGAGVDAVIASKRIPTDARYYVIATRFGQEQGSTTGQYTLLLERVGTGAPDDTAFIRYGESALGRINSDAPLAFYFLRAARGEVIEILMRRTSGNLDAKLSLATPDGVILVSNDDDPAAEGTLDARISNYTILETGVYLIVATRFGQEAGDTEGSYVLTVTQKSPEELGISLEEARLIDYGMTVDGAVDDEIPMRYYRFEARRGDVITVALSVDEGNLDPLVKLTDANLVDLAADDDGGENNDAQIVAYTVPIAGTYYLVATRVGEIDGRTSGSYELQLNGRAGIAGGDVLEIIYDATVSGLIDNQHPAEEYVFFGQQGDVIQITMERVSGDLDSLITLYDSERKQIAFDDDSGDDQNALLDDFVLPSEGTYIFLASRYDRETGLTSGAYILTLDLIRSGG